MGSGIGSGKSRAREAAVAAISSPLLEASIDGARGVVFNITGGSDLTLHEVSQAADIIYEAVDPNANIIFGAVIDERLQGEIRITVIATGFSQETQPQATTKTATVPQPKARSVSSPPATQQPAPEPTQQKPGTLDIPEFLRTRRKPQK